MQEISLKCEWCGQATVAPAELLGKSIPCPGCSAPLSVQEVVVATIAPAAAVQTPTRSQRWATASTQQSPTGRATRIQSNLMTTLAAHFSWLAPLAAYGLFFLQFALPREVAYKFGAEVFFGVPTMLTILGAVIGSTSAWAVRRQGRKGLFWLALAGVLLSLLPWLLFGAFLLAIMISHPNGISL